jgi:glucosamine--fructose-6-phosphate aminotransferase (isomerizing)
MNNELPASLLHVFERQEHPYHMWDGIQSIPKGLEEILAREGMQAARSAGAVMLDRTSIHLLGCGTSYFAAIALAHAFQQIAHQPAYAWEAFEFLTYPPVGIEQSAVVGISHTGGTPAVVKAVEMARQLGAVTIGHTDEANSALTRASDQVFLSAMGAEPALPKTRSYLSSLMRGFLESVELASLKGRETSALAYALKRAPKLVRQVLEAGEKQARELAERWSGRRRIVVSGGGPHYATALEGMLKLTEAAMYNATAWEIEEAVHGTWASTTEEDLIIQIAMDGPSYESALRLAGGMKTIDAQVWVLTDRPWNKVEVDALTLLPTGEPELFTPLYAILPLYQFAYFTALAKKLSPDSMRVEDPRFLDARKQMRSSLS